MSAPFPPGYRRGHPHQWHRRELLDLAQWCADVIDQLDVGTVWDHIADWTPSRLPAQAAERVSGGGVAGDGSRTGTTPQMVVREHGTNPDRMTLNMRALIESIVTAARALEIGLTAARTLAVADGETLREILSVRLPPGVGPCANPHCARWCTGGADRLRSGRCHTCAEWSRTHNATERPHALCHRIEVGGCPQCEAIRHLRGHAGQVAKPETP